VVEIGGWCIFVCLFLLVCDQLWLRGGVVCVCLLLWCCVQWLRCGGGVSVSVA